MTSMTASARAIVRKLSSRMLRRGIGTAAVAAVMVAAPFPPYPDYGTLRTRDGVNAAAHQLSRDLTRYIKRWMAGTAPARIPQALIPTGVQAGITDFTLQRPEDVDPAAQWGIRPTRAVNPAEGPGLFPDPHTTYLVMPAMLTPFDTKVVITGEFPHARFFDIQVSPPFDPNVYYGGATGVAEVPLVDADITPDGGNTNPFRPGADRTATRRRYTVTLRMAAGNAATLNPDVGPPYYRHTGNERVGGGLEYSGPAGCDPAYQVFNTGAKGCLGPGDLWIRYYAPDRQTGPLGGVPLPKVLYQLHDGRRFYIQANISTFAHHANEPARVATGGPQHPSPATQGPSLGWAKEFGIPRIIAEGYAQSYIGQLGARFAPIADALVRDYDKGINSHGEDLPPPGNSEHTATEANYIDYLTRGMSLGPGMVLVLTGQLPTTPRTLAGTPTMHRAQARYWSITSYANGTPLDNPSATNQTLGVAVSSVMDEQITTNDDHRYIIVYSRVQDRPANATAANGVTWVDWGPASSVGFTIRWMSVAPQWSFCRAPDQAHLNWNADAAAIGFNPNLLGHNTNQTGFLGEYQPVLHYMSGAAFAALANHSLDRLPTWTDPTGQQPGPPARPGPTHCR